MQFVSKIMKKMIQNETLINVADNSGAKLVKCLKILGSYKKKVGKVGDILVVSIKKLKQKTKKTLKVKKKDIFKALIIRTKHIIIKNNGFFVKFSENAIILLDKQKNPIGTRLNGFILKSLKKKFIKVLSISINLI